MINRRLSSTEAAARLGVKPATLYAYVSRGLVHPERSPEGSTYDPQEIGHLARSSRAARVARARSSVSGRGGGSTGPDPAAGEPIFVTELTLIEDGHLYYRGLDAVEVSRTRSFEETASWLWSGYWDSAGPAWSVPEPTALAVEQALASMPDGAALLETFMVAVVAASLADDLRHDLNPAGVPVTGRILIAALAGSLPLGGRAGPPRSRWSQGSISSRVWRGLGGRPADHAGVGAVEAALVLAADHELAPSTMAARVAASFRADPYAAVLTALGPASGSWYTGSTGAPSEVEALLRDAADVGPERAMGNRLRRSGEIPYGFGMPLYPEGDPRGAELLGRLEGVGSPERLEVVRRVVEVGAERGFPPPNFDLGLGALAFCADLRSGSGQAIFTIGKVAGWLAHAIEEYRAPTRFRSRADYVGTPPVGAGTAEPAAQ